MQPDDLFWDLAEELYADEAVHRSGDAMWVTRSGESRP
jgi:hypothetical protein